MIRNIIRVASKNGLHARQASRLVQESNKFESEITLGYKKKKASAKSILGVIALGVPGGEEIVLEAEGRDEEAAARTIATLICNDFNKGFQNSRYDTGYLRRNGSGEGVHQQGLEEQGLEEKDFREEEVSGRKSRQVLKK